MKSILQFNKPADFDKWEEQALVIGNGYMGASLFGGISTEKLVLNEKTLWSGGKSPERDYNGGNIANRFEYVRKVQELLKRDEYGKAVELLPFLTGEEEGKGFGAYQRLCEVYIDFPEINGTEVSEYSRSLDMSRGVVTTSFKTGYAVHERSAFANYPNNVIVMQISTNKDKLPEFKLRLDNIQEGGVVRENDDGLLYFGALRDNGLRYAVKLRVVRSGNTACIYITAGTDYAPVYPDYRIGLDPSEVVSKRLESAIRKGAQALSEEHIKDFGGLFNRVSLNLGDSIKSEKVENFFRFGRYLLISSSRNGSLPANLQGVWNESNTPPWCCDYHTNINLQMNYWHAHNTNLAECCLPLVDFLDSMREPGRVTAKEYYGLKKGFVLHTQTNPFGWTAPGWDFYWGWSTAASAWLMQNLWEHYDFTRDVQYLKERIYPIMREAAVFYSQWLTFDEKHGRLVSSPSYSPEHGPVTFGNVYEQCLIEQFFSDFIDACEVLFIKDELYERILIQRKNLKPYVIGKNGQLSEWYGEEESSFDRSGTEEKHRHISHLLGLYPGKLINKSTPELMKAAVAVLEERGDKTTGWARAFRACLWARAAGSCEEQGGDEAERAFEVVLGLIDKCTYGNMLSFHPPFQIDGNFGGTAAITEMLLQSHNGYIEVFPVLPKTWRDIEFSGLCARGGFEVSAKLCNGKVKKVCVLSDKGNVCRIKIGNRFKEFTTEAGGIYDV
jgi:alpha-L-fucosidase 2